MEPCSPKNTWNSTLLLLGSGAKPKRKLYWCVIVHYKTLSSTIYNLTLWLLSWLYNLDPHGHLTVRAHIACSAVRPRDSNLGTRSPTRARYSRSGCSVGTCLGRSYRPRAAVQQEPSAHAAQDDHKPAETRPACHRAGGSSKQVVVEVSMEQMEQEKNIRI